MQQLIDSLGPLLGRLPKAPAYLDPGSGSFILQLLLAALVGSLFLVKSYWKRLGGFFRRLLRRGQDRSQE
jgi:hypothetical protein